MLSYKMPAYIINAEIDSPEINYIWNDSDVDSCLDYRYAVDITDNIQSVSWRSKITLIAGVYEWILGRFHRLCHNSLYFYMADAAYCGAINTYYLIQHYQLDDMKINRYDYLGPVEGALWCAGRSSLLPGLYIADTSARMDDEYDYEDYDYYTLNKWEGDLQFIIALTLHILPQDKILLFKNWIEGVVKRLLEFYIQPEEDPFANLFGYKSENTRLGNYVAREILDLNFDYNPEDAITLCDRYLQSVNYTTNPFLLEPKRIKNKIKIPYRLLK